ncbi:hypothetical protein BGM26_06085 [Bacillus sp. FJAT-29790]|uniref:hypothetical protein n=1 Tax=Bacillus sp. FJAT-29790 TaxID=1895002 RepID=UPI001C21EE52|nr:hypothetical protein [Bacillus sp. FJAT-29790]MBU8878557.1 hypothetical protein [Bacillus sp. FJAT-29790]
MSSERQSAMMEHTLQELYYRRKSGRVQQKPYVLALLTSHVIGMDPGFSFLRKLSKEDISMRIAAEDEIYSRYSIRGLVKTIGNDDWIPNHKLSDMALHHVDTIFIPILSFSIVSDILSLNDQRPFVRHILTALLTGKRVIGLKHGADPFHQLWRMKGMDKGPDLLKRKLNDQMLQLKAIGIKLIDETERIDFTMLKTMKKTVITEESIRFIHQQNHSRLVVTNDTIITPLAEDKARELNIALIPE